MGAGGGIDWSRSVKLNLEKNLKVQESCREGARAGKEGQVRGENCHLLSTQTEERIIRERGEVVPAGAGGAISALRSGWGGGFKKPKWGNNRAPRTHQAKKGGNRNGGRVGLGRDSEAWTLPGRDWAWVKLKVRENPRKNQPEGGHVETEQTR